MRNPSNADYPTKLACVIIVPIFVLALLATGFYQWLTNQEAD